MILLRFCRAMTSIVLLESISARPTTRRSYTIKRDGTKLLANFAGPNSIELVPNSAREFSLRWTAGKLVFDLAADGKPAGFTFHLGGEEYPVKRLE